MDKSRGKPQKANGKWFVAVQCMHSERILKEKLEMLRDFLEEIRRSEASGANGRTDRRGKPGKGTRKTWFQRSGTPHASLRLPGKLSSQPCSISGCLLTDALRIGRAAEPRAKAKDLTRCALDPRKTIENSAHRHVDELLWTSVGNASRRAATCTQFYPLKCSP